MFCFQCEQTASCNGCRGGAGVCGKKADTAELQDELTGALIGLARACLRKGQFVTADTYRILIDGLFTTVTNVNFNNETISAMTERVRGEKARFLAACGCTCGGKHVKDVDMQSVWAGNEDIRSLKSLILFGIRGMAAYAYHAAALGFTEEKVNAFFPEALAAIGREEATLEDLLSVAMKVGEVNFACMELLDKANTSTYGNPEPVSVALTIEPGPFVVITGHDLHDLEELLKATDGKGVNVYTHGEMLPAHAYGKLKKYAHLKGHFGTAWHNQQKEFADLPAPILFTTNCLMPPKPSYADRVFTTGLVSYPGMVHVAQDFSPVVERAIALGGFKEARTFPGINGGVKLTTGFGHHAILGIADKVVDAVKSGAIKHFYLVGGCDGAKKERAYYTDFVKNLAPDTIVLTLACGKYRFNDLELGDINGIPRLLDMGQCNDAYGAIKVADALAKAFNCGVNDLPLSMVISWYEQKAVCILLTLLYLGITNINLGPSLPAFISPNVLNFLVENFKLAATKCKGA